MMLRNTILSLFTIIYVFSSVRSYAETGTIRLNTKIEFFESCLINNQGVDKNANNTSFGELNFGNYSATFDGSQQTQLTSNNGAGLTIRCEQGISPRIKFGPGLHDRSVPEAFASQYFRAVSNGQDYIAYNIILASSNEVLSPNKTINLNRNGEAQTLNIIGEVVNNGRTVSAGQYTDTIAVTLEF